MEKYKNHVDLVKNFPTKIYFQKMRRYSRGRVSQSSDHTSANLHAWHVRQKHVYMLSASEALRTLRVRLHQELIRRHADEPVRPRALEELPGLVHVSGRAAPADHRRLSASVRFASLAAPPKAALGAARPAPPSRRVQPSSAEFVRVLPSSAEVNRVRPSIAEFTHKPKI